MASNVTPEYGLNQWSLEDNFVMEEFNTDNRNIEQALLDLKASLPKFQIGKYGGTDTYGEDNPNTLTFDFEPQLLIVAPVNRYVRPLIAINGAKSTTVSFDNDRYGGNYEVVLVYLQWDGNTVSWYNKTSAASQHNESGATYRYIAIG